MTLPAGTRLGTYEVVALIGAGGMGEVYRARDVKLRREVAIKVLPPAGTNADAMARFEREAHAVAALSHPNILAIFDFGTHDGSPFAVMELLDGGTLRDRLADGALPRREAIDYAVQIAKGLAAAHEKGIVHRDLKPENVFITADRRAKILDFGLAKHDARIPIGSDTETQKLHTEPGVVLGTTPYMSPEQVRGGEIDSRSDIFAFGAVLSEMLTGRRAFARDSGAETLTAILKEDPPDLSASVPPPLARIVERCLQKRPADRFQSARDLAFALEALTDSQTTTTATTAPPRSARMRPSLIAGAVAIAVIASAATWLARRAPVAPIRMLQASIPDLGAPFDEIPEISPDGTRLAYFRGTALHVERLDTAETIDISLPAGETVSRVFRMFFWSPDGASLAFGAANKLWRVAATGGTPSLLCDIPDSGSILGGSWSTDDTIVFSVWQGSMYRIPASGGRPEKILAADPAREVDFHSPQVLPGSGGIIFIPHRQSGISTVELLSGGKRSTLLQMPGFVLSRVQVDPAGFLLLDQRSSDGIWAVPFSLRTLKTTGAPYLALREGSGPTVSRDGALVYLRGAVAPVGELVNVTPDGTVTSAAPPTRDPLDPAISPDGQRVAVSQLENERHDIWVYDLPRQTRTRLSHSNSAASVPVWVAGGNRIVYVDFSGGGRIMSAAAAGEGGEQLLPTTGIGRVDISRDGKWLAYATDDGSGRGTIYAAPLDANLRLTAPARRVEGTFTMGWRVSIAPQADLIAYASAETDDPEMYVHSFPDGNAKWQISTTGGISAAWNHAGDRIYYTTATDMMEVEVRRTPALSFGAPHRLFGLAERRLRPNAGFDIGPDGRFLMVRDSGGPITMVVAINGERLLRQAAR